MDQFPGKIQHKLRNRKPVLRHEWDARPAAVLIPLYLEAGGWHALYTKRTEEVEDHQGQVSFPGGVVEEGDETPIQTAVREAYEEIGVAPEDVSVLGVLDTLLTTTHYQIVPVVGVIPWPYPLLVNVSEVASTFGVPLSWLADPANHIEDTREVMPGGPRARVFYFKPYNGEIIWGATARITLNFLEMLK